MSTQTASAYWQAQEVYPFPFTKKRRLHELNYLVPRILERDPRSLLDLGCGDGSLLEILLRITDVEKFYGFDIAETLLEKIDDRVETAVYYMDQPTPLPQVDVTIIGSSIQYIFDDDAVERLLREVTSDVVWIRSSCTLQAQDESIERDGYASLYRTVPNTFALISRVFKVSAVDRVYPDAIESPFGTKQFYFEAHRIAGQ